MKHNLGSVLSSGRGKYSNEFNRRESILKKNFCVVFVVNDGEADWKVEDMIGLLKYRLGFLEAGKTVVESIV